MPTDRTTPPPPSRAERATPIPTRKELLRILDWAQHGGINPFNAAQVLARNEELEERVAWLEGLVVEYLDAYYDGGDTDFVHRTTAEVNLRNAAARIAAERSDTDEH